jgi:hypothetical protein
MQIITCHEGWEIFSFFSPRRSVISRSYLMHLHSKDGDFVVMKEFQCRWSWYCNSVTSNNTLWCWYSLNYQVSKCQKNKMFKLSENITRKMFPNFQFEHSLIIPYPWQAAPAGSPCLTVNLILINQFCNHYKSGTPLTPSHVNGWLNTFSEIWHLVN